jgi:hypothetical protein
MTEESLAKKIGDCCGKTERSVKFHAVRMMLEVLNGGPLPSKKQKELYNKMKYWKSPNE